MSMICPHCGKEISLLERLKELVEAVLSEKLKPVDNICQVFPHLCEKVEGLSSEKLSEAVKEAVKGLKVKVDVSELTDLIVKKIREELRSERKRPRPFL